MASLKEFFSEKKIPYTLFGLALVTHLIVFYTLLYLYGPCSFFLSNDCALSGNDTQHYVIDAYNLTHGHGYSRFVNPPYEPDALRTPLLPLYFATFTFIGGYSLIWLAILLLNIFLSIAPAVLYKLSRLFLPHGYALVAGLMLVLEPLYLYRSQIAEPDALLVLLLLSVLYFLVRSWKEKRSRNLYIAAVLIGVATLAKPTMEYLVAIICIFEAVFLAFVAKEGAYERLKKSAAAVAIVFVIVSPWLIRNKIVFGITALSSIQGYNLYEYYTVHEKLPDEQIPASLESESREPDRFLPLQKYFTGVALARIRAHPFMYLKEQTIGSLRNLFVSDIADMYYYGQTKLLPFAYNPESKTNPYGIVPKILWMGLLALVYALALIGWISAWRDRIALLTFTLFFLLFGYLVLASGPYVDAKYRLPALPLLFIMALYGLERIRERYALPLRQK